MPFDKKGFSYWSHAKIQAQMLMNLILGRQAGFMVGRQVNYKPRQVLVFDLNFNPTVNANPTSNLHFYSVCYLTFFQFDIHSIKYLQYYKYYKRTLVVKNYKLFINSCTVHYFNLDCYVSLTSVWAVCYYDGFKQ